MQEKILSIITEIEKEHDVQVLYACESGSRAWGFASPDSDYDVRFIYKHKKDYYLQIDEKRDVIELPVDAVLDVNGWDIKKALKLFRNSNAPLFEWLQSPIVYKKNETFVKLITSEMNEYFSFRAAIHHYLSMAANTNNNSLKGERINVKKYFYALRPLLAAMWIYEKQEIPPMEFSKLRSLIIDNNIQQLIDQLLEIKIASAESALILPFQQINDFIAKNLERVTALGSNIESLKVNTDNLNILFRKIISEL